MAPYYEYACNECGYKFEVQQSMKDKQLKKCPKCKKFKLYKVLTPPIYMTTGAEEYPLGGNVKRISLGQRKRRRKT